MIDLLRRYFVANRAGILSVRRFPLSRPVEFIRCRCGNADGLFWGRWQVMWRTPYNKAWAFDGARWVPAYTLPTKDNRHG